MHRVCVPWLTNFLRSVVVEIHEEVEKLRNKYQFPNWRENRAKVEPRTIHGLLGEVLSSPRWTLDRENECAGLRAQTCATWGLSPTSHVARSLDGRRIRFTSSLIYKSLPFLPLNVYSSTYSTVLGCAIRRKYRGRADRRFLDTGRIEMRPTTRISCRLISNISVARTGRFWRAFRKKETMRHRSNHRNSFTGVDQYFDRDSPRNGRQ